MATTTTATNKQKKRQINFYIIVVAEETLCVSTTCSLVPFPAGVSLSFTIICSNIYNLVLGANEHVYFLNSLILYMLKCFFSIPFFFSNVIFFLENNCVHAKKKNCSRTFTYLALLKDAMPTPNSFRWKHYLSFINLCKVVLWHSFTKSSEIHKHNGEYLRKKKIWWISFNILMRPISFLWKRMKVCWWVVLLCHQLYVQNNTNLSNPKTKMKSNTEINAIWIRVH